MKKFPIQFMIIFMLFVSCGSKDKDEKRDKDTKSGSNLTDTKTDKSSPIVGIFSIVQDGVCLEYDSSYNALRDKVKSEVENKGGKFNEGGCSIENASGRCTKIDGGTGDDLNHTSIKGTTSIVYYWTKPRDAVQRAQQDDCLKTSPGVKSTYSKFDN